ncbi:MAG: ribosome-associated translation inhibitor RaiA [Bacilli bacterium]|nr:ribosome-associated translation inhibitor RaiA [Bacilli bacterium]
MKITIRGDKIKITDSMKEYIEEKLSKLDKYLKDSDNVNANVVVKVKNINQILEITIPLKNIILRSEESQDDFYKAVDKTIDKLERQIRKNKTRLSKHTRVSKEIFFEETANNDLEDSDKIIKRKKIEVKPMNEEEAVLQMELLGHEFYMYLDSEKDKYCVVYKRKDGGYGVLES